MRVVLFCRRNVGLIALSHLVSLGHEVKCVTDDDNVKWLAQRLGVELVKEETMGEYDYIFSVHWNKKIDMKYISGNRGINFHPCLSLYKGANPVKRYLHNMNMRGSVGAHYMNDKFDSGEVIHEEFFTTPILSDYAGFYNIAWPVYWRVIDITLNKILGQ